MTITVNEELLVADPCYIPDSLDGRGTHVIRVVPGEYDVRIATSDEGEFGNRVESLSIAHRDCTAKSGWHIVGEAYVDSGQMSFCDTAALDSWGGDVRDKTTDFHDLSPYEGQFNYLGACYLTLNSPGGVLDDHMCVSQTGYGDGAYPVSVQYGDTLSDIVAVRVDFLLDDEEEDDYGS